MKLSAFWTRKVKMCIRDRRGTYALAGGVVDPLPEDAPQFVKDYYAYYKRCV